MSAVDIITKFTYLTHGQNAPRGSSFKGTISTASIIGFREYTEREKSKVLSEAAHHSVEQRHGFFGYTSQRVGATKTYSSDGWMENKEQDFLLREKIANAFCEDGHLLWTPVISLESFDVSFDNKLFNEEDYAQIMDKVLPKWFASAGFQNDNMIWWVDHHVNTDNPHLHFSFLEKTKTKTVGKLSMKDMNRFKTLFWNEVFSRREFLNSVGQQAEDAFKQKDLLKRDMIDTFSQTLEQLDDKNIENMIKALFEALPSSGRLQYGGIHMKEYRTDLDNIVEAILQQKETNEKYQAFMNSVSQFDSVRNENLHTKDFTMTKQEDTKLRKQLANLVLGEYKSMMIDVKESAIQFNSDEYLYIPIAKSLIEKKTENEVVVRVPGTQATINVAIDQIQNIQKKDNYFVAILPASFRIKENDKAESMILNKDNVFQYFSNGKNMLFSSNKKKDNDKDIIQVLKQKELSKQSNESRPSSTLRQVKHGSWGWMKKVQKEMEHAQEEFYRGKEMNL